MSKQRNIRKRRAVDDDDDIPHGEGEEDTQKPLSAEEIRFLQKQRQRKTVSSISVSSDIDIPAFGSKLKLQFSSGGAFTLPFIDKT